MLKLKEFIAVGLILTSSLFAHAVKVGDTVLLNKSGILVRTATVAEIANDHVRLSFGNSTDDPFHGQNFEKLGETVFPYRHLDELSVKNPRGEYSLRVGSPIIFFNSATAIKGVVRDLTADGLVRLDFSNTMTNISYGTNYVNANSVLPHETVNQFSSKSGTQYNVGMEVLLANSVVTQRGKVTEISSSGFAYVAFDNWIQNNTYAKFYDLNDQQAIRQIPSTRLPSFEFGKDGEKQRISLNDDVEIRYFEWQKQGDGRVERVYVGNFVAKVAEISSAGFARLVFADSTMQAKNSDSFFPVATEVKPLNRVDRWSKKETTTVNRLARLLGKTPVTTVIADHSVGDEVLIDFAGRVAKAKIQNLTADGQAQFQFQDPVMNSAFGSRLLPIVSIRIETIRNAAGSCEILFQPN